MAGEAITAVLTIDAIVEAAFGVGLKESFKKAGGAVSQKLKDSSLWKKHTGHYHKELVISLAKGRETWETLRNEDQEKFNNADESAICVAACHSELGCVLTNVLLNLKKYLKNKQPPPEECKEWIKQIEHAEKSFLAAISRYPLISGVVGDRQRAELKQLIIETRERLLLCSQKPTEVNATGQGSVAAANIHGDVIHTYNNYYNSNVSPKLKELLKGIRKPTNLQLHWKQFHKGTREWIFAAIHGWFKSSSQNTTKVFALVGHAGVGKSTFAAQLVLHGQYTLQPSVSPVAAYFFYDHQSDRSAKQCVLSLCKQLCGRLPQFHECLDAEISQEDINSWSAEVCFRELLLTPLNSYGEIHSPSPLIVVIDALDECGDPHEFKQTVVDQWENMPEWLLLFVTCRPNVIEFPETEEEAAREGIVMLKTGDPENNGESECVKKNLDDIKIVLRNWLENRYETSKDLKEAVADIAQKSGGLFLYLRFFRVELSKLPIGQALKPRDMVQGIGGYYKRYFDRLLQALGNDREAYKLILGSILASREPIPLALWMRAVGVQGDLEDDTRTDAQYERFEDAHEVCKSLMYIPFKLKHTSQHGVSFIHKSMSDFLTGGKNAKGSALNLKLKILHVPVDHNQMVQLLENLRTEELDGVNRFVARNLFYHRCKAGLFEPAAAMLFDLDELLKWLKYATPTEITHDIAHLLLPKLKDKADTRVVLKLLRLGQPALTSEDLPEAVSGKQFPSQLPGQILGRLSKQDAANRPNLRALRDAANSYDPGIPWLKPTAASLNSALPGGLVQTLNGHSDSVSSVAFNHYGTRIVSGSWDHTIRNWDAVTGQPIGEPLKGHSDSVSSVAFNHDGTRIVSGSDDRTIRIWDAVTGQPIGEPLKCHSDSVSSVAFNHDGTRIVSGSWDHTIRNWDAATGQPIGEPLKGHSDSVSSVAFNHDGTRIVSGSHDNEIRIWDAVTGQPIGEPLKGHYHWVSSVAFNHDGTRIVSGSWDHTIRIWDAVTGQPIGEPLKGHSNLVYSVAFNHDGTRIVSGSGDKTIRIWDAVTGQPIGAPLKGHSYPVISVAFNHHGTRIVSGSWDKTIRIWDAVTGQPIGEPLKGHYRWVSSVAFNHDGTRIVSGSNDNKIRIWDAVTGQPIGELLKGHYHWVSSVAFNHDGTRIVSGSRDHTIRIWDAVTGQPFGEPLKGHSESVWSVAFNHDGTRIVSGSRDKTIRIWDTVTGQPVGEPLKGHYHWVSSAAFNHDGTRIVSGSDDETIRIWDAITGQPIGEPLQGHSESVWSVAFSHDGTRIVSGSNDNTIRIWDAVTGQPIGEPLQGHSERVNSVAFNHDGTRIVSCSDDNKIRIWDAVTGQPIGEPLKGHSESVNSVAFNHDGTRIVSCSRDKTIRIWDAVTGQPVREPLEGHSYPVNSVAFNHDGTRIVSGSRDKTVRIWDAVTGQSINELDRVPIEQFANFNTLPVSSKSSTVAFGCSNCIGFTLEHETGTSTIHGKALICCVSDELNRLHVLKLINPGNPPVGANRLHLSFPIKLVEILAGELKASVIPLQVRLQVEQANADKVGNTTTSGTPRTRIEHDDQSMENVVEQPIPFLDEIMRKNPAIYQSSSTFDSVPGVKVRRIANLLGVRDAIGTCQVNCQIASAAISHGELDVAICLVDDLVTRAHSIQPSIAPLIYSMCSKLSNSEQFISVEDNVRVKVQEYMLRFAPSEDLSTLLEKHVSSEMKELLSNVPTQFSWTTFDFVTEEVLENHSPQMNTVTSTSNWTLLENMQRLACFTASHIASNNSSEVCFLFQSNIHLGAAWVVVGMCEPRLSTIGASTLFQLLAHGCPCKICRQLVSNDELNVSSHSQVWHEATKWLGILVDTATIKEVSRISIAKKVLATIETAAIALLNPESQHDVVKRLLYSISNRCLGTYLVWVHEQFDNVLVKSEMSHTSTLFADIQTCVTSMRNKVSALSSGVRIRDLCGSEVDVSRLATDQEYTRYMVGKAAMNIVPYALSSQHETQSNVSGFGQSRTPLELDSLLVDAYERELETIIEEAAAYGVEKEMVLAYFVTGVLSHDPCVVVEEACQEVARRHLCAGNALEILTKSCEQWILHLSLVTWNSLENSSPTWKFRFVLQLIEENIPAENKEWEPVRKSLKRKMAILSTFSKLPPHSKLPVGVVMRPPTKLIREVLQSEVPENYIARSPLHRNTEGIEHRVQKDEDTFDRTAARDAIVTCMSNLGVKDGKVFSRLVSKLDDFVPALPEGDVILSVMYQWVQLDRAPASASQMNTNGESVLAIDPSVLYSTGRQWKKCKELLAGGKLNWKQVADFGCKMCYDGGLLGIADIELRKTVVQECARTVAKRKPLRGDNDEEKVKATERLKNAECFLQALEALGHVVPSSMYDEQKYTTAVMHQLEYTQGNVDEINKLVAYVILFMNGSSSVLDTIVNYLGKGIMKECWGVEPSNWADMVYQKCATTVIENLLQAVQTKDNESSSIADVIEWPPRQVETATVHLNKLLDRLDDTSEPIMVCDCIVSKQRVREIVQNFAYEQRDVSNISNQEMKVKIVVLKACEAHGIKSVSSETICSSDPGFLLGKVNSTAAAHDGISTTPDAAQSDLGKLYACYDIITTSWSREEVDHTKLHMDDVSSQQQVVLDMINTTSCEEKERLVEVARTLKLLDPRVPLSESHHTGVLSMYQVEIATMRALNKLGIDSVGEPRYIEFDSPLISCWESLFMRLARESMHDKVLEYLRTSHHSAFSLSLQSELDLIRVCLEGGTGLNPKKWIETICIGLLSPHQEVVDIAAEVLTSKCPDGLNDFIMESTWLSSSLHHLFTSCVVACCDLFQVSRCPVWQGLIAGLKSQNVQDVAMIESHPWMVVNLVINELIFQAASVVQAVRQTPHNLWCGDTAFVALEQYLLRVVRFIDPTCATFQQGYWSDLVSLAQRALDIVRQPQELSRPNTSTESSEVFPKEGVEQMNGWRADFELDDSSSEVDWSTDRRNSGTSRSFVEPAGSKEAIAREMNSVNGWGDDDLEFEDSEVEVADECQHDASLTAEAKVTMDEASNSQAGWGDDDIDLEDSETETAVVDEPDEPITEATAAATEVAATSQARWGDEDIVMEESGTETAAVDVAAEPVTEAAAAATEVVATTEAGWGDEDIDLEESETETAAVDVPEEPVTEAAAAAAEVVATTEAGWGDEDIDLEESETEIAGAEVPEEPITEATAAETVATTQAGWGDDDIDLEESETEIAGAEVPEEPITEATAAETVATTQAGWGDDDIDLEESETEIAGAEVPEEPIAEAAATKAVVTTETGWGDEDIDLEDSETETAAVDVAEEPITEDTAKEVVATSEAGWGDQDIGHEGSETEIADADVPEEPIAEASAIEAVATTEAGWGDEDIDLEASETETAVVDVAEEPVTEAATATEVVATTQAGWGDDDIDLEESATETADVDVAEEPVTEGAAATEVVATSQAGWGDDDFDVEESETEAADVDIPEEPITEATAAEVVATTKAGWGDDDIDLEESETETAAVEVPEEPVTEATAAATQVVATTEAGWGDDDIDVEESETETAAVDVAEEPITEADAIEAVATTEAGWGDEDIDLTESDSESFAFGQTSEKTSNGVAQAEESVSKNVKEAQNAELRSGDVSVEAKRVGTFPSDTGEVELHVEVGNGNLDPIESIDSPESGWGELDNVCSDNEPDDKGVEGTSLRDEPLDTNGTKPQLNSPKEAVPAEISSPSSSAIAASSEMLLASPIASLVSPVDASGVKSPKSLVASANRRRYRSKKLGAKRLTKK